jgi:hypothetical protein
MLALLSATVSSCVVGNDSNPPLLSVDFFWEHLSRGRSSYNSCEHVDVAAMDWELRDASDNSVIASDSRRDCADGFDFPDVLVGRYDLSVNGYDENDKKLWNSVCRNLVLDRFNVLYSCTIDLVGDTSSTGTPNNSTSDEDAGTP